MSLRELMLEEWRADSALSTMVMKSFLGAPVLDNFFSYFHVLHVGHTSRV